MKTIRYYEYLAFMILCSTPWIATAAEPRQGSPATPARDRGRVVQVRAEAPPAPSPSNVDEELETIGEPLESGSIRSWSLTELEGLADEFHPALQRDRARIESARGDALQKGLYPNPRFDSNNPQVFNGQGTQLNAGVMQEFVVKGKKRLDRAAAVKVAQQSEFDFLQDRFALHAAIRQQYYVVLAAERRLKVLQKLQEISASSLATGRILEQPAGELAHIDVLILEIDNQRIQSDLENALRLLRGARNQLAAIVGDPSIHDDEFQGSLYTVPPQYDEAVLNEFVASNSAYVQVAKLDVEKNEILLKRAVVEPYPNVTLGPAYNWGIEQNSQQFWLTIAFPIPTWDRNQGNIMAANADLAGSRRNVEAVQLELLRKVADAYSRHRAVRAQAAKYRKEIIPNSMNTLKLARRGFAAGEYDFIRYLQVQRTVIEANMTYIGLLETVWTSAAELSGLLQLESFEPVEE